MRTIDYVHSVVRDFAESAGSMGIYTALLQGRSSRHISTDIQAAEKLYDPGIPVSIFISILAIFYKQSRYRLIARLRHYTSIFYISIFAIFISSQSIRLTARLRRFKAYFTNEALFILQETNPFYLVQQFKTALYFYMKQELYFYFIQQFKTV